MFSENNTELREHKKFYANGQRSKQEFYRDEKLEGNRKYWYENGQIWMHEFYRDGKLEGESKIWYENGQIVEHRFYIDGKQEGKYRFWYKNGKPRVLGFYRKGKKEGISKTWYHNGNLFYQEYSFYYQDGELLSNIHIDANKNGNISRLKRHFKSYLQGGIHRLDQILIPDLISML